MPQSNAFGLSVPRRDWVYRMAMMETSVAAEPLIENYLSVRQATETLATPLTPEDQQLQSKTDCSSTKWHRAHTSWFFETFLLSPQGVPPYDERFGYLFNSYYEAVGPRHARPRRGMVSRPSADEIGAYRRAVDERMVDLLHSRSPEELHTIRPLLELGLHHEQQHQELILTDILHAFSLNPMLPAYRDGGIESRRGSTGSSQGWLRHPGGLVEIGAKGDGRFCFDNERARHKVWLEPFAMSRRLVSVGEWKAFAEDGGYRDPSLWLSDGIDWVRREGIDAPGYARKDGGALVVFGLHGEREAADDEPVTHVSFYEADAMARYLESRLPTEAEWEAVAASQPIVGNFVESGALRALPADSGEGCAQLYGDAWEWTRSAYGPYPGYTAGPGALGEYNGKFMSNQHVLRGGSAFTPASHIRPTYRNFWYPDTRFQLTGVRLAR